VHNSASTLSDFFLAETIVGVNKYALEKEVPVEVFTIDNSKVIAVQVSIRVPFQIPMHPLQGDLYTLEL